MNIDSIYQYVRDVTPGEIIAITEKNELLSTYLKQEGVQHVILNAKNHEKEGEIIAQAGRSVRFVPEMSEGLTSTFKAIQPAA